MDSDYDTEAWAGETKLGRRIYNHNFRMLGSEVPGWKLVKIVPMHKDPSLSETVFLWQSKDEPDRHLVRIQVSELSDWRAAQKRLVELLGLRMRPGLPRGTGKLAELGDIEFVARAMQSDIPAAIQFTRGNIVVAIDSVGSVTFDVSKIAGIVDHALREPPIRVRYLRTFTKLQSPKTVLIKGKAGARVVKDVNATGDGWLKVIVPDGELRRSGNGVVYNTTQTGKKPVQIFSVRIRTKSSSGK